MVPRTQPSTHASAERTTEPSHNPSVVSSLAAGHPLLRRVIMGVIDAGLLLLAPALAYEVGFEFRPEQFSEVYRVQLLYVAPFLVAVRMVLLWGLGLYRGFTRYASIHELFCIGLACAVGTVSLIIFNVLSPYLPPFHAFPAFPGGEHILRVPWSVVIMDALLAVNLVGGVRMMRRLAGEALVRMGAPDAHRVLIIGAGDAGEQVARGLLKQQGRQYRPVAFIDPDPGLHGRRIHGLPVVGGPEDLDRAVRECRVNMVVVALPKPTPGVLRSIVDRCQRARIEFKIVPDLEEFMKGAVEIRRLRPVEIDDLLGRPPVVLRRRAGDSCISGRRVLVTGAGGSIGSELCRQALLAKPARLVLLGRGENSLYDIHQELLHEVGPAGVELIPLVGNVCDAAMMEELFAEYRPELVFHAAAHKHVHLMEAQPAEAIKNNLTGTRVTAEAALRHTTERFILISTDKAVAPRGVMGASKRAAEMMATALNECGPTRFISVRFGNVLGSRGSVIPLFQRQIAAGGPVTVTDPEVTRYFMTIPEAVSLVIEAGSIGSGGEVFLLDMGQPIRILDLARQLITLSGLEPERDIGICFTGLRPGEKLTEELLTAHENRQPTGHDKIWRSPQTAMCWEQLEPLVKRLEQLACRGDQASIRRELARLIPDYTAPSEDGENRPGTIGLGNVNEP